MQLRMPEGNIAAAAHGLVHRSSFFLHILPISILEPEAGILLCIIAHWSFLGESIDEDLSRVSSQLVPGDCGTVVDILENCPIGQGFMASLFKNFSFLCAKRGYYGTPIVHSEQFQKEQLRKCLKFLCFHICYMLSLSYQWWFFFFLTKTLHHPKV